MVQPLPTNSFRDGPVPKAYERALRYERDCSGTEQEPQAAMPGRLLGYLIHEAPTERGRSTICNEINDCTSDEGLRSLADLYINNFLQCFISNKGATPVPSEHVSRPSFNDTSDYFLDHLEQVQAAHRTAKAQALSRDNYRCLISGTIDLDSLLRPELAIEDDLDGPSSAMTELAHIFDSSTNWGISEDDPIPNKQTYSPSVWSVLFRLGGVFAPDELLGAGIYRLENAMTLSLNIYSLFDRLAIWLEADPTTPNRYKIQAITPSVIRGLPEFVYFRNHCSTADLPLPDPRYLALHAAACGIAHLSGAGEYIETLLREFEEAQVLSNDGTSAHQESRIRALGAFICSGVSKLESKVPPFGVSVCSPSSRSF